MKKRLILIKVTFHLPNFLIAPFVWPLLLYRRIRYGYPFRRIPLTRGKYAIVDPEDYWQLRQYKWQAVKNKAARTFYASRGRRADDDKSLSTLMHRQIMNVPAHILLDHINHNGLDNRKANLRSVTAAQNNFHRKKYRMKATSKYKGLTWHEQINKWDVRIMLNRKSIRLGYFDNEILAAKAYDNAARKFHGEFASLNFPLPR